MGSPNSLSTPASPGALSDRFASVAGSDDEERPATRPRLLQEVPLLNCLRGLEMMLTRLETSNEVRSVLPLMMSSVMLLRPSRLRLSRLML